MKGVDCSAGRHEWVERTDVLCDTFQSVREEFGGTIKKIEEWAEGHGVPYRDPKDEEEKLLILRGRAAVEAWLKAEAWKESPQYIAGYRAWVCKRCMMQVVRAANGEPLPKPALTEAQKAAAWERHWGSMPSQPNPGRSSGWDLLHDDPANSTPQGGRRRRTKE